MFNSNPLGFRVGIGLGIGLSAGLALHVFTTPAAQPDTQPDTHVLTADGTTDLSAMRREIAALRHTVDGIERTPAPSADDDRLVDTALQEAARPARDRDHEVAPEDVGLDMMDAVEDQLDIEEVDAEWSGWASEEISRNFTSFEIDGGYLVDTECRSSICRVELDFSSSSSRDEGIKVLPNLSGWDGQGFFQVIGDDELGVVAYYARENNKLPSRG